jgi:hypothetical protein
MEAEIKELVSTPVEKLLSADRSAYVRALITLESWHPFPTDHEGDIVASREKMKAHPSYGLWSKANGLMFELKHCFACGSKNASHCTADVRYGIGLRDLRMYDCGHCRKMSWFIVDSTIDPPHFGTMDIADGTCGSRFCCAIDKLNYVYGTN